MENFDSQSLDEASGASRSQLAIRRIGIDTYRENVAYLHRDCAVYRAEGFQALSKISVHANGQRILATLNVVDDLSIVGCDELGLSEDAFTQLGVRDGHTASLWHAEQPVSIAALHRKIAGERLDQQAFCDIIADLAARRYSKIELAAFVVSTHRNELDREEVYFLTSAMVASGQRLQWHEPAGPPQGRMPQCEARRQPVEPLVVDKHCIGGIPGNRTSMLVVPIVAAHGLLCPKTSSRAITSPAGTADTMEVLARVELGLDELDRIVREQRGCLAWGGTADLSPADDVLISVERPLGIDSPGQMVASILSKKIAAGSNHLVLDIPIGASAKVRSVVEAQRLRRLFEYVAARIGLSIDVVITDGRQPIGQGIGPVLEARDVMRVLHNDPLAPADLREKSLQLAGRMIECDPAVRGGEGLSIARAILESGRALEKMNAIIQAQGATGFNYRAPLLGERSFEVTAPVTGVVTRIDNLQLARIAGLAGAPKVRVAGVDLLRKLGQKVAAGEALYRVHARFPADLAFARKACSASTGYTIGLAGEMERVATEF